MGCSVFLHLKDCCPGISPWLTKRSETNQKLFQVVSYATILLRCVRKVTLNEFKIHSPRNRANLAVLMTNFTWKKCAQTRFYENSPGFFSFSEGYTKNNVEKMFR